ncbi:hypothetical protein [Kurthia sp. Dielmo]|uniref:hypothetical protein n=1 Tax=Kurthia sp. Dielmo TaxID=1033738 RepID=UPI00111DB1F4|nr:hypothetical protein [Kurthia sp. Dielmo]
MLLKINVGTATAPVWEEVDANAAKTAEVATSVASIEKQAIIDAAVAKVAAGGTEITVANVVGLQAELDKKLEANSLSGYAKTTDVTAAVAGFAKQTDVDTALLAKADVADLNGLATETFVNGKIDALVGGEGVPEALNTLKEISTAVTENKTAFGTVDALAKANQTEIAKKANQTDLTATNTRVTALETAASKQVQVATTAPATAPIGGLWLVGTQA